MTLDNNFASISYKRLSRILRPRSRLSYATPEDSLPRAALINFVEHMFGISAITNIFEELKKENHPADDVFEAGFRKLNIRLDYDKKQLAKIPKDGPVIFISNHAFGLLDGMMLNHLAAKTRSNFKTLLNRASTLCRDEHFGKLFLPIDFEGTKEAIRTNIESKKQALRDLKEGGTIIIFPSGGTATAPWVFDTAVEGEWKLFSAKMIQMSKATVVPTYFPGQNSFRFHLANKISRPLRYALVVNEMWRRRNSSVRVEIGDPIPFEKLSHLKSRRELLDHIRGVVFSLDRRQRRIERRKSFFE
ncbi:MAG: putative hemolysin [Cellvibrionaceae bacterium]|jgi:putative hemolysin